MPVFTHVFVTPDDADLIEEVYQFGVANPLAPQYACSSRPHALKSEIEALVNNPEREVVIVYADGEMRMVAGFNRTNGMSSMGTSKPFGNPWAGEPPTPEGMAMATYLHDIIRSVAGTVRVHNPNPGAQDFYEAQGVQVDERS